MPAYLMSAANLAAIARAAATMDARLDAETVFNVLLDENLKSLGYRYPDAGRISEQSAPFQRYRATASVLSRSLAKLYAPSRSCEIALHTSESGTSGGCDSCTMQSFTLRLVVIPQTVLYWQQCQHVAEVRTPRHCAGGFFARDSAPSVNYIFMYHLQPS